VLAIGFAGAALVGLGLCLTVIGLGRKGPDLAALLAPAGTVTVAAPRAPKPDDRGLRQRLDFAGLPISPAQWHSIRTTVVGIALASGVGLGLLLRPGLAMGGLLVVLGAGFGYVLPGFWLDKRAAGRQRRIDRALPETLDLLALTVQAGLGLEQALASVAEEIDGPLRAELDRTLREQQLGRSRHEALQALGQRTPSDDLRNLIAAMLQAERLGAPLTTTLNVQARELRRRRRGRAREQAGKTPVKLLFPLVFGIFPALFIVILGPGVLKIMDTLTK
jgi:tight adherence protein C